MLSHTSTSLFCAPLRSAMVLKRAAVFDIVTTKPPGGRSGRLQAATRHLISYCKCQDVATWYLSDHGFKHDGLGISRVALMPKPSSGFERIRWLFGFFLSIQQHLHRAQAQFRGVTLPQALAKPILSLSRSVLDCTRTSRLVTGRGPCCRSADVFVRQLLSESACNLLLYGRHGLTDDSEHGP